MSAQTWTRILTDMAYNAFVSIGMHRIERTDVDEWTLNGEALDLEFALYALVTA